MKKFRIYLWPMFMIVFVISCAIASVNSVPQQKEQDSISTTNTNATASSFVTPINSKVKNKKATHLITKTSVKRVKLENVNITELLDTDKVDLSPEFLENTMDDYIELSKAINDDAPNETVRERRTLAAFQSLRARASSGVSLLRSLSPRLATILPSPSSDGSSDNDSGSSSDPDSGSGSSSQGSGARFLAFARRILTSVFNFLMRAFTRVREFFSSGAGAGLASGVRSRISGLRSRVSGLFGRGGMMMTDEAPLSESDLADDSDGSSGADSSSSSGSSSGSSSSGGYSGGGSSSSSISEGFPSSGGYSSSGIHTGASFYTSGGSGWSPFSSYYSGSPYAVHSPTIYAHL